MSPEDTFYTHTHTHIHIHIPEKVHKVRKWHSLNKIDVNLISVKGHLFMLEKETPMGRQHCRWLP